ncbi:hypothetical protein [Sphingomonas sp. NIC1]|uniref:hypothetical protein n=1 Tax=Sphingomonas sp. NIC1 TaxID=1961362 RepID=UPI00125E4201|nr:hypothetical protein [Sphingomonas sp. NIC1]
MVAVGAVLIFTASALASFLLMPKAASGEKDIAPTERPMAQPTAIHSESPRPEATQSPPKTVDPEAFLDEQYRKTIAGMGAVGCGQLAQQAAANSCVAQMYRNNSVRDGYYTRANGLASAAQSEISGRCPADIQMASFQYSTRLFQRAYEKLAAQAPYASNASKILEAGVELCTDLAFDDMVQN